MKWVFIIGFGIGVLFVYFYFYRLFAGYVRRRWSYRIRKVKRNTSTVTILDRWLLDRRRTSRNEKIKLNLQKAGYSSLEQYLWFKKLEWFMPVGLSFLFISVHIVQVTLNGENMGEFHWKVLLSSIVAGWVILHVALRWKARERTNRIGLEVVRFSDRLLMSLSTKTSLFYSIKRAGRTTKVLKPYIELLLIEWSQTNPKNAIRRFMERVATDEIVPLTNAMLVIVDHPAKAEYLMEQQMKNVETIRDFVVKQRIKAKPIYMILLVTIPFTAGMIALIAPWYSETVKQLQSVF
jgi:hypothetical protein